ncbi:MAG: ketopantoate reductase family protein [Vicinamibacterales bacterium]
MKIAVFGAGGVGTFYGGLLARAGRDVHFVARGAQLEALRTRGLHISSRALGEIDVPPVRATDRAAAIGHADLVLVAVKAHQTAGILDDLATLAGDDTILMALQNGVESDELLAARFGEQRVAGAVVYVGATLEQPGVVRHVAAGTLVIGDRGAVGPERIARVRDALASTGLPVHVTSDLERQRWHKLAWNASFNAVSALTLRTSQDLLATPAARELLIGVMREVVAVARARGVSLGEADIEQLVAATEKAAPIRTSMLVDRERGRPLETDALVGVILRKGREAGVATPIASTLYALLAAIAAEDSVTPDLPPMEAGSFSPQA